MDTQGEFEVDQEHRVLGSRLCCQPCMKSQLTTHSVASCPDGHHCATMGDNRSIWACWTVVAVVMLLFTYIPGTQGGLPASVTGFYTDSTAQQTILLDENISPKQRREIRNEILHLLGLEHKPKIKTRGLINSNSAPQFMLELYRTLGVDGEGYTGSGRGHKHGRHPLNLTYPGLENKLEKADLIMSFVNQAGLRNLNSDGGRRFFFDFSGVKSTESVTGAELRIFKYATPWLFDRGPFNLKLFKIKSDKFKEESVLVQASGLPVHALAEGWLDVEATAVLRDWVLEPEENVVLYLEVTDKYGVDIEPSTIGLVDNTGPKDKQAFLVTCFKATHKLHARKSRAIHADRVKRSPAPSNYYSDERDYGWRIPPDRPNRRACQRRQLYVSFKALGWESWVIAPEGYPAYYCQGECMFPLNAHMNATNHAIVQALVHLVKPFLAPNPSCAPTTLNGISFLFLDNSYNVVLKQYKNMVVQACGCH